MAVPGSRPHSEAEAPASFVSPHAPRPNAAQPRRSAEEESRREEEEVPQEFECVICMKILLLPVTTPCGHNFCKGCIDEAVSYRPCCPLCRCPLLLSGAADPVSGLSSGSSLRVNTLMQQLLERNYPQAMRERRQHEEERRQEAAARRRVHLHRQQQAAAAVAPRPLREEEGVPPGSSQLGPPRRNLSSGDSAAPRSAGRVRESGGRPEQILTLFRIFDAGEGTLGGGLSQMQADGRGASRPSWRGSSRAAVAAARAAPLFPGETISLHVYEEKYIRLVELALQVSLTKQRTSKGREGSRRKPESGVFAAHMFAFWHSHAEELRIIDLLDELAHLRRCVPESPRPATPSSSRSWSSPFVVRNLLRHRSRRRGTDSSSSSGDTPIPSPSSAAETASAPASCSPSSAAPPASSSSVSPHAPLVTAAASPTTSPTGAGGPPLSPARGSQGPGDDGETPAPSSPIADASVPLAPSAPEYGCCVQIEQHTPLEPVSGGTPGRCLIRCVCRNRFRVRNKIFLEDWTGRAGDLDSERGEAPAAGAPLVSRQSTLPADERASRGEGREEARVASEAAEAADATPFRDSAAFGAHAGGVAGAPRGGGFYYEIGYCEPIFDDGDREEAERADAAALRWRSRDEQSSLLSGGAGLSWRGDELRQRRPLSEEATDRAEAEHELALERELRDAWIDSENNWGPLTRASDLARERAKVVHALEVSRHHRALADISTTRDASEEAESAGDAEVHRSRLLAHAQRREVARDLRERCVRRLCEICIEGLERQLQQAGDVAQRLFASKFGRMPSLSSRRMTAYDLEKFSFFVAMVIVSSPAVRWQWFLLTDTTQRLVQLTKVIAEARWMNILALNTTPLSSLSRFLLFQDFHSNVVLFLTFLCVIVVFRLWPSLFFDDDFF
ncbi:hypothetical protein BESB_065710 [Besnoitia besnoiti]|uniref:RING-type domain-containing protein n=1 Tax=Besnoitia besnoiti TaxID=94643 RepID=A0A2A9M7S9_BESBE|nr:hypothetical protein BESB_065710 [Besnoitia besnoiti]PFH34538.1 hypothetical protein BESB_065710 [Besnoitia besnoiti]